MSQTLICFLAIMILGASTASCGKKERPLGDEPTKYQSQSGLEELTRKASQQQSQQAGIVAMDNPAFLLARDLGAKAGEVKELDQAIRPILQRLFGGAKIVAESTGPQTQKDGEIIENKFTYVVKKTLIPKNGESLHAALHAAHFGLSPRLGSKPTIWSQGAVMSLFYTHSSRPYSLVIKLDSQKQKIIVESYKLGSKYDRLM